jgi:hypothetical protein
VSDVQNIVAGVDHSRECTSRNAAGCCTGGNLDVVPLGVNQGDVVVDSDHGVVPADLYQYDVPLGVLLEYKSEVRLEYKGTEVETDGRGTDGKNFDGMYQGQLL